MERIFDRIGFFVENSINLEGPPKVVGLRSGSVKSWGLLSLQVGFIIDWSSYGGLGSDWLSGHDGNLCLRGRRCLDLG